MKKICPEAVERQVTLWLKYWNQICANMKMGTASDCFAKQFVQDVDQRSDIDEVTAAFVAGSKCFDFW